MTQQHSPAIRKLRRLAALACACGLTALPAVAQDGAVAGDDIQIKVSDLTTETQLIRVPVNKSVVVDFNLPVREARLVNPKISEVAATSPKQIVVNGKAFGTTQMVVWFDKDRQHVFDLAVDLELERMLASIRNAVPRSKVKAYTMMDSVVLTGRVPTADAAKRVMDIASVFSQKLINHMDIAGVQQVMLQCTVAEMNRSATKQLGFNGFFAGEDYPEIFGLSNVAGINPSNIGAPEAASVRGEIPFVVGEDGIPVTGNTTLSLGFPRAGIQIFMQALRENGLLRVLAEPTLVAINGQNANFLAGGEFPVPIPNDDGIGIEFREFGVRLNFTPVVIGENKIRLQVAPEVSEPDFSTAVTVLGTTVPGLSQRRVSTVVELAPGETLAIGGLLSERTRAVSQKVPGLGDIPVLGALFRSVEYQSDKTELVILVTPELVDPVSPNQITYIPGGSYVAPNDIELFLMGEIEGADGKRRPSLRPRVNQHWPTSSEELYGPEAAIKLRGPLGPAGASEGS